MFMTLRSLCAALCCAYCVLLSQAALSFRNSQSRVYSGEIPAYVLASAGVSVT